LIGTMLMVSSDQNEQWGSYDKVGQASCAIEALIWISQTFSNAKIS
jgi:hypothetical protein